jgi:poly(A) polymerase
VLKQNAKRIASISAERIRDEVTKILALSGRRRGVERMMDLGLLEVILPEVAAMHGVDQPPAFHPEGDVLEHTLVMLDLAVDPTETLAFGILLHDVGKPVTATVSDRIRFHRHAREGAKLAASICKRFRFSNAQRTRIVALVKEHMKFMEVKRMRPSTLKRFLRQDGFEEHLELHRLDCAASHGKLDNWEFARERIEALGEEGLRPAPLITGRDLMDLHIPRGPLYGRILSASEEGQLAGTLSTREEALELAKRMWEQEREPRR